MTRKLGHGKGRNKNKPLPPWHTLAIPGTEEKIKVFRWRVRHGYAIFHPLDYREDRNPT